jgi:hypothetical protein
MPWQRKLPGLGQVNLRDHPGSILAPEAHHREQAARHELKGVKSEQALLDKGS